MAGKAAYSKSAPENEFIYPKDFSKALTNLSLKTNILIYGEEGFSIEDCLDQSLIVLKKMAQKEYPSVTVKRFHCSDDSFNADDFFSGESTLGLFADESFEIIVLRGLEDLTADDPVTKRFVNYISNLGKTDEASSKLTIIPYGSKKISAAVTKVIKHFHIINCKKLYENDIMTFTTAVAGRTGKNFTDDAISELVSRCRGDMYQINSEIKRLSVLCHEAAEIETSHIEENVEFFFNPDSFQVMNELDNAIFTRNLKSLVSILEELLGKGVHYMPLVMRLMSIFRNMLSAVFLKESNEKLGSGVFKIAAEFAEGMRRKTGYQRFAHANDCIAKLKHYCEVFSTNYPLFRPDSRYDLLYAVTQNTLNAIYYSKNYKEDELFELLNRLYSVDVRVKRGILRVDQRPEIVKEELFRIFISIFTRK